MEEILNALTYTVLAAEFVILFQQNNVKFKDPIKIEKLHMMKELHDWNIICHD